MCFITVIITNGDFIQCTANLLKENLARFVFGNSHGQATNVFNPFYAAKNENVLAKDIDFAVYSWIFERIQTIRTIFRKLRAKALSRSDGGGSKTLKRIFEDKSIEQV